MRFPQARRKELLERLPPKRCNAKSKRTGERCRRWSSIGATTCHMHGAPTPSARVKAERRVALAEAFDLVAPRSTGEMLLDAAHICDVMLRQAKHAVGVEPLTAEAYDLLASSVGRLVHVAKIVHDAGLSQAQVAEDQSLRIVAVLEIAGAEVGLDVSSAAWRAAVGSALRIVGGAGPTAAEQERVLSDETAAARRRGEVAAAAERERLRADVLAEVRADVQMGRPCRCCGAGGGPLAIEPARPAECPAEPSTGLPSHVDGSSVNGRQGPLQPADGPVRAVAEVGPRAITSKIKCPGCGGSADEPGHDQRCGWSTVQRRNGFGGW